MKRVLLLLAIVLAGGTIFAQRPAGWNLTFADEFDGRELDLTKWSPHDPLQTVYAAENPAVSGGQLHLKKGAAVTTFGLFAQIYGRFEIRCRLSGHDSARAGVRLLPVPSGRLPSIDLLEAAGSEPAKYFFANHWGTQQTERSYGDSFDGPDLTKDFHVLAVEWDADRIVWFIDGKEKFRSQDGIPKARMYVLVDLQGDVDYIRVYRRN